MPAPSSPSTPILLPSSRRRDRQGERCRPRSRSFFLDQAVAGSLQTQHQHLRRLIPAIPSCRCPRPRGFFYEIPLASGLFGLSVSPKPAPVRTRLRSGQPLPSSLHSLTGFQFLLFSGLFRRQAPASTCLYANCAIFELAEFLRDHHSREPRSSGSCAGPVV